MKDDLLLTLASLPDEALVPVGWVRELLEEARIEPPALESTSRPPRWPSVKNMGTPDPRPEGTAAKATIRDDLVGDGWDDEPLLTVKQVAVILSVPVNTAYELPIDRIRVGRRNIRFRPQDVHDFIQRRSESL